METVCHVITKLELGGAQEIALYAVSHLDRGKYRPVLVTGPGGLLTEEARRLPGVQTIVLSSLGRRVHAISDLLALIKLIFLFHRLRPTIVHTHSSKAGILGRWAAWLNGVPITIHTVHGFGVTPNQPAIVQRLFILLERMTGWVTTHWITVAQSDTRKGREWRLFDTNVSVVRPGIDPAPFQRPIDSYARDRIRREFGAGPEDVLIGTIACLKPQKAPEDVIAVAKRLCERVPQARFVLIGDGELRPRVEALIHSAALQDRVCLAGWRRDIDTVMRSLDVLLLTSHWEGLPRVILEASATGVPIVATRVGGVEEGIERDSCARLCAAGDIDGLTAGLEEILQGSAKGGRGGSRVNPELPKEFHIQEMVKQYQSLYDRLLSERRHNLMPRSLGRASQP